VSELDRKTLSQSGHRAYNMFFGYVAQCIRAHAKRNLSTNAHSRLNHRIKRGGDLSCHLSKGIEEERGGE